MNAPELIATPRAAAGVLFFDTANRVLFVIPTYKPTLDIPGGYMQPGETPAETAVREVKEELRITVPLGPMLVVDWAPQEREGDKILFVFDGGVLDELTRAAITPDGVEVAGLAHHGREEFDTVLIPRLARRLHAALDARAAGHTLYLQHGTTFSGQEPGHPAQR